MKENVIFIGRQFEPYGIYSRIKYMKVQKASGLSYFTDNISEELDEGYAVFDQTNKGNWYRATPKGIEELKEELGYKTNLEKLENITNDSNKIILNKDVLDSLNISAPIEKLEINLNPDVYLDGYSGETELKPCVEEERLEYIIAGRKAETKEILEIYARQDLKEINMLYKASIYYDFKYNVIGLIRNKNPNEEKNNKESKDCQKLLESYRESFIDSVNNSIEHWNNLSLEERERMKKIEREGIYDYNEEMQSSNQNTIKRRQQ